MGSIRSFTRAFNGGEISKSMYGRIDDSKYQMGLALCKNFIVETQGPLVNRPGFQYVNAVKDSSKKVRLIPFNFSNDQTMVLEFGHHYVRFHTYGATLLGSNGLPYEVATPYDADDLFELNYVQSADIVTIVHPFYAPRELRRYGPSDWRMSEIKFGSSLQPPEGLKVSVHFNTAVKPEDREDYEYQYAVTALLFDGSQESERSAAVTVKCNPFADGAYQTISWNSVSGAGLYRVYRNRGGIWAFIGQTREQSIVDQNIDPDASITPPIYDDPFAMSKGIDSITITNGGSGYKDSYKVISGLDTANGIFKDHDYTGDVIEVKKYDELTFPINVNGTVGKMYNLKIDVIDDAGSGSGAVVDAIIEVYKESGWDTHYLYGFKIVKLGSNYVSPRMEAKFYHPTKGHLRLFFNIPLLQRSEQNRIPVVFHDTTGSGAEAYALSEGGVIRSVHLLKKGKNYSSPTLSLNATQGSGAVLTASVKSVGDYPGAVAYFEQRRWFGGTYSRPNILLATKSGTESDMSYSLPSQDDDRIFVTVAANQASRIRHICPLGQLLMLTDSAEWRVSPLNSDAITPSSMSVRAQSFNGANNVQPIMVNRSMIYAMSRGGHLRESGYDYNAGGYVSNDVCLRASHLFNNLNVVDLAYSKAPEQVIWAVSSNGMLISFVYVPDQQVGAFSRIVTKGVFESCCTVIEGDEDILYCVIRREINGKTVRFVERMHERQYRSLEECVYLDCSGTYRGDPKTEVTGLTWLEGCEVSILADGAVVTNQVVTGGKVQLPQPARIVHVGLPYECDIETLPLAFALQDGSYGSSHQKNVKKVYLRLINSSGIKAGPSFERLTEYPPRGNEAAGTPPDPINDEIGLPIAGTWTSDGHVCVRQSYPLPMRIISMTIDAELV